MHATKHIILYADDDQDDQQLVIQAFEKYNHNVNIETASNGVEALKYLKNLSIYQQHPCLIILDINMPKMDGKETLMKIRQTDKLKDIPVVLFSTSASGKDKEFAHKWDADFISKPVTYTELISIADEFIKHCGYDVNQSIALKKVS
jgi:CheY-like chemotaxis protein